jgi:hypothetical protein
MERSEFIARLGEAASPFVGARAAFSWIGILVLLFALAVGWWQANIAGIKFRPALHAFKSKTNEHSLPWPRNVLCTLLLGPFAPFWSYQFIFHSEKLPADRSLLFLLFAIGPLSLVFLLYIWTRLIIDVIERRKKKSGTS